MAKARIEYAAVVGTGQFPFDMLRYDFCSPASESKDCSQLGRLTDPTLSDKATAEEFIKIRVVVVKRVFADCVGGDWTPARWQSFGWELVAGMGRRRFEYEDDARRAGENYAASLRMHNNHMRKGTNNG